MRTQIHEWNRPAAIWAVAAFIAVMFMGSTLLTPLYVLYQDAFGFSKITLTLIYAAYVVGNLIALFFLGRISDQIGRRRASLPAIGVASVSTLLYLFAEGTAWLFVARVLSGLAIGVASATGTAWLAELHGKNRARATLFATAGNLAGIGVGPIAAGVLAQYAPWPFRLSYIVYFAVLAATWILVARTPETVARAPSPGAHGLTRIAVPREIRTAFLAPAAAAVATFAFIGFYAALVPSLLVQSLHQPNHAIGGAVVSELLLVALLATIVGIGIESRRAMLWGLVLLIPSVALLVAAQALGSMATLLIATTIGGIASAFGFRGSLHVVNRIAPSDRRAEVVSCYLVACYVGNAVPVVGVGILSTLTSSMTADAVFAATIGLFAVVALIVGTKYVPQA